MSQEQKAAMSLCPARAVNFQCLDMERSILVRAGTSSEYLGQVYMSRSSGKRQGHRNEKVCLQLGLPSTERQR